MRSSTKAQRGSAAVEFALVLPVLLLVCVALVQVGLLARDALVLSQAARAGAREAAVDADDAQVRRAVDQAAVDLDPALLDLRVLRGAGLGDAVTVEASYRAPVASVLTGWLLPADVVLRASATMRQEFG